MKLARALTLRRKRRRPAPPDLAGLTKDQLLLWAANNAKYEDLVSLALRGRRPIMVTAERREAELRAEGRWPAAESPEAPATESPEAPAPPLSAGQPAPAEPEAPPAYWEEKCWWRHRGPQDYADWESDDDFQVDHDYDPLED